MPNIEITVEKSFRVSETVNVSRADYNAIKHGGAVPDRILQPLLNQLPNDDTFADMDYAICDENNETLIPWR